MTHGRSATGRQAVLYARVSSERQAEEGWSHDAQVRRLREYARTHGLRVQREFVATESAKDAGRRAFHECVDTLRQADGPRVLLVEKIDRATQYFHDFLVLEELRESGIEIHSTRDQHGSVQERPAHSRHVD